MQGHSLDGIDHDVFLPYAVRWRSGDGHSLACQAPGKKAGADRLDDAHAFTAQCIRRGRAGHIALGIEKELAALARLLVPDDSLQRGMIGAVHIVQVRRVHGAQQHAHTYLARAGLRLSNVNDPDLCRVPGEIP